MPLVARVAGQGCQQGPLTGYAPLPIGHSLRRAVPSCEMRLFSPELGYNSNMVIVGTINVGLTIVARIEDAWAAMPSALNTIWINVRQHAEGVAQVLRWG